MTVTDASGRVLFRRAATADEIAEAITVAADADAEAEAALARISAKRRESLLVEPEPYVEPYSDVDPQTGAYVTPPDEPEESTL